MILLTSNHTPIAVAITGIVLILGLFGFGLYKVFIIDKSKAKKILDDYLNGLADEIYKVIVQTVKEFKIEDFEFETLEEYEAKILEILYNIIYEYTLGKIKDAASDENSPITFKILEMVQKEDVDKIIEMVYNNGNVRTLIKDAWAKYFENKVESIESMEDVAIGHDIDGNEIIYSGSDYNEDFDEKNDLPVVEEENINEEDYRAIIPPSDNENPSFDDDTIMEDEPEKPYIQSENITIEEDLPMNYTENEVSNDDLSYFIDKNGRKRDKITGRYTK